MRMNVVRRLLPVLALLLGAIPARAGSVFVNAVLGVDDEGYGKKPARPWKSLTYALAHLPAAASDVHIAPGIYDAANGESFPIGVPPQVSLRGPAWGRAVIQPLPGQGALHVRGTRGTFERLMFFGEGGVAISLARCLVADVRIERNYIRGFSRAVSCSSVSVVERTAAAGTLSVLQNTIHGCGTAISVTVSERWTPLRNGIRIDGNVLHGNDAGMIVAFRSADRWELSQTLGILASNNTIVATRGDGIRWDFAGACRPGHACTWFSALNNLLVGGAGFAIDLRRPSDSDRDYVSVVANQFWANARGMARVDGKALAHITVVNAHPGFAHNLSADPLFVDPARAELHLLPGSPAIDRGMELAGMTVDIDGALRQFDGDGDGTARVDIGADEYDGRLVMHTAVLADPRVDPSGGEVASDPADGGAGADGLAMPDGSAADDGR